MLQDILFYLNTSNVFNKLGSVRAGIGGFA